MVELGDNEKVSKALEIQEQANTAYKEKRYEDAVELFV